MDTVSMSNGSFAAELNATTLPHPVSRFHFVVYKVVTPILFGLISLVGTIGNSLVIYVIVSNSTMRTVTNLLLLNLAFADLAFVIVVPPSTAYLFVTSRWPFGDVPCKLMHYMVNVTAYVTVYTLVLISAIRFMTIVYNTETVAMRTRRNVVVMVIGVWAVMLVLNAPILSSYGLRVTDDMTEDCDNYGRDIARRIFATFFVFAYLLPLGVIGILSLGILRHIGRHRAAASMLQQQNKNRNKKKNKKSDSRKKQAGRLLVVVVVLFALLWLPVHVHLLVAFFGDIAPSDLYEALTVVCHCLAYFNSCVNPIIYNRTSKEFRDAFRQAVCCGRWRENEAAAAAPVADVREAKARPPGTRSASGGAPEVVESAPPETIAAAPEVETMTSSRAERCDVIMRSID